MTSVPVQGAQVVSRVATLLRIVGRQPEGSPLVEVVRESGLTRPTVHRLLSSLASEGLLDQDPQSGNWVLGPEILLMGSVASARFPLEDIARPSLRRLA
jgi:DNA-binding IclR family transcriptional regulator